MDAQKYTDFSSFLADELMASEKLRSTILIILFGILTLLVLLSNLILLPFFEFITGARIFAQMLLYFFVGVFLYELLIRITIIRAIKNRQKTSRWIRYGNALEEASIPSIGIIVFAQVIDPIETLLGPASFMYFIFIVLGALRLNYKISAITGLMAAAEYFGLSLYYIYFTPGTMNISPLLALSILPKCGILVLTGVLTGIVTLEIRRRIQISFNTIQEQNRQLEKKVKERTEELETLNINLKKRVEEAVQKSRENEQLLVQHSKMSAMGEMISMIAHQWKQPLASIAAVTGNIKVLQDLDQLENENISQFIEDINSQTHYLSDTITDFRKFLSPTKKKEIANFGDIVENALKIIGKSLETKNVTIEKKFAFKQSIETFPNELIQVIINLLKNAQDACLEKGIHQPSISLEGGESGTYQKISVKDNGGGIPDDIVERIFDPYFTTKGDSDGTGLGLYMSKTIVEKHCHGSLVAFNSGEGACFEIKLPMMANANAAHM